MPKWSFLVFAVLVGAVLYAVNRRALRWVETTFALWSQDALGWGPPRLYLPQDLNSLVRGSPDFLDARERSPGQQSRHLLRPSRPGAPDAPQIRGTRAVS